LGQRYLGIMDVAADRREDFPFMRIEGIDFFSGGFEAVVESHLNKPLHHLIDHPIHIVRRDTVLGAKGIHLGEPFGAVHVDQARKNAQASANLKAAPILG
jgi:hypothetical protein